LLRSSKSCRQQLQQGSFLKQLSGIDSQGMPIPYASGHFFLAINIECFTGIKAFKKTTGDILRSLRASRKASGETHIYTRGKKEHLAWKERANKGVPLDPVIQQELRTMRDELGLPY
jgi:L-2-hydroxycarboxylate dehydrogenase (NAD+)